jgi:hypothetical protein
MPYEGEYAQYKSIRRLVENDRIKHLLGRAKIRDYSNDKTALPKIERSKVRPSSWQPELVLAIDGSHQEEKVENGFPGAEVGYVTVASVLMDVAKIRKLDEQRPVNPQIFRTTEKVDSIDCAFPGCNVVLDGELSPKASLRKALFETFSETRFFSDSETLLETFEALLDYRSLKTTQDCPIENCFSAEQKYIRGKGCYSCSCLNVKPLYSTDSLRIHEGMVPDSSNGAMFAEIMQVLERILVIHILRWLEQNNLLWLLSHIAIIVDGPLAVFGHPAGLLQAIDREINRINEVAKKFTNGEDLLLIGIEKSGAFVTHFENIDKNKDGSTGAFPNQTAGLLTDDYIKRNIVFSDGKKFYGSETYFGRKFFYKTSTGSKIVASLPFLNEAHRNMLLAEPEQYPRLADALGLFEQLASSRYPNAISPLISANAEAAIPMNLGSRVLEKMAKELIKEKHS